MATPDELKEWLASGFEIRVDHLSEDQAVMRVRIPEFGIAVEGEAGDDLLQMAMNQLAEQLSMFVSEDLPLPDRSHWVDRMEQIRAEEASDERQ